MSGICTRRLALALLASPFVASTARAGTWSRLRPATVMVIPSLHQRHQVNPNYTYDDLYRIVRDFRPDRVGVEIRPDDMTVSLAYLAARYPQEMVALKAEYGDRTFGFDWSGDAPSVQAVPIDWHTKSQPADGELSTPERRPYAARLTQIAAEQDRVLTTATPYNLANGRFEALCVDYNTTLRAYTAGTPYEAAGRAVTARDAHLAANIAGNIRGRPGDRVAVVTGAEHYGAVVRFLRDSMASQITLASLPRR